MNKQINSISQTREIQNSGQAHMLARWKGVKNRVFLLAFFYHLPSFFLERFYSLPSIAAVFNLSNLADWQSGGSIGVGGEGEEGTVSCPCMAFTNAAWCTRGHTHAHPSLTRPGSERATAQHWVMDRGLGTSGFNGSVTYALTLVFASFLKIKMFNKTSFFRYNSLGSSPIDCKKASMQVDSTIKRNELYTAQLPRLFCMCLYKNRIH